MGRPARRHPLLRLHRSPEAIALIGHVRKVLGGFEYQAVDQVGGVTVFRVDGVNGSGLLADRSSPVPGRPGVRLTIVSGWARGAMHDEAWLLDARLYRGGTGAAEQVEADDSLAVSEIPHDAVPGFTAGLSPEHVRELAVKHAPELLA